MKNQMRKLVSLTLLAACLTAGLATSAAATSEDSSSGSIPDGLFTCTTSRVLIAGYRNPLQCEAQ